MIRCLRCVLLCIICHLHYSSVQFIQEMQSIQLKKPGNSFHKKCSLNNTLYIVHESERVVWNKESPCLTFKMLLISEGFSKTSSLLASLVIHHSKNHSLKEQILSQDRLPVQESQVFVSPKLLFKIKAKHLRSAHLSAHIFFISRCSPFQSYSCKFLIWKKTHPEEMNEQSRAAC